MKRETVLALNALNQAFYAAVAPEFSETRKHAWPGFDRVLALARPASRAPFRVLDAGAGDGRFAAFLEARRGPEQAIEYLGIDASERLLEAARARALGPSYRFEHADFILADQAIPDAEFDLVGLFGVLHHVPSFALRARLIERLAQRTAAGGSFALTFWRLDRDARFSRRVRSLASYNASAAEPIPESELEPGDRLLGWGTQARALRYCHFPDEAETEALIAAAKLPVRERFSADGRGGALNDYVVFSRR